MATLKAVANNKKTYIKMYFSIEQAIKPHVLF